MVEQLKEYVYKNDLVNITVVSFWIAFNNWKTECFEDYSKRFADISLKDLVFNIKDVGIRASAWPECDYSHVTITISVVYNGKSIGEYSYWHPLGNHDGDDFLAV